MCGRYCDLFYLFGIISLIVYNYGDWFCMLDIRFVDDLCIVLTFIYSLCTTTISKTVCYFVNCTHNFSIHMFGASRTGGMCHLSSGKHDVWCDCYLFCQNTDCGLMENDFFS